ncbi:MAG: amino acid ABC transporter permease [Alphaproteobacteria bacterium]
MADATIGGPRHPIGQIPDELPPRATTGVIGWLRANLFSSASNSLLTVASVLLLIYVVPGLLQWAIFDAVVDAGSRSECRAISQGACWAVIAARFDQFIYGFYPAALRWRVNLAFVLFLLAMVPILFDNAPYRRQLLWFSLVYPVVAIVLLLGGFGLQPVETDRFGGILLTMVIGITGIVISLPIGIVLALGRQSNMIAIKALSVIFIEFIRGVPLITLLFVASTLLNYFLPPGTKFDLLLRVIIMVTLFASAYMAEVIRGGLAAIPRGQYEAADSIALTYWQSMRLIILPQALKISIPGIVNTFIGLFKDTTLVLIIGLLDPLGITAPILADSHWNGLSTELYVFVALFFWVCTFSMSRYSQALERKLHTGL